MKRQKYFLFANKTKIATLFNNSSPPHYCSAILENIHLWQMDYFDDAFHTFLGFDSIIYLAVNGTVTSLMVFIQNILNCVPKKNKAFTGLERHGGK